MKQRGNKILKTRIDFSQNSYFIVMKKKINGLYKRL